MKTPDMISVLVVNPGSSPVVRQLQNNLESLQEAVSGYIEVIHPHCKENSDGIVMLVNEDGKLFGLPCNRILQESNGSAYACIVGTALIVGCNGRDFLSLSNNQISKYSALFANSHVLF